MKIIKSSDSIETIVEVMYGNLTPSQALELEMSFMKMEEKEKVKAIVQHVYNVCEKLIERM